MSESAIARSPLRGALWTILRVAISIGAFAYVLHLVPRDDLGDAVLQMSLGAIVLAIAITVVNTSIASLRWRLLFEAYGAPRPPKILRLWRLYLVGQFYSTFLPGGVGGDVVRGVASRGAFEEKNITGPLAVVLVDRVLGLSGLLLLTAAIFWIFPVAGVDGVFLWSGLGLLGAASAIAGIALGRHLVRFLPRPLARLAQNLPKIERPSRMALALALSLGTQSLVALTGHVLVRALADVSLSQSFILVPLANAAIYVPLTIAGAGAREAAFVALFQSVGVDKASAIAASLCMLLCQLVVAGAGGIINAVAPLRSED